MAHVLISPVREMASNTSQQGDVESTPVFQSALRLMCVREEDSLLDTVVHPAVRVQRSDFTFLPS